jgi:hypothetical protein
VPFETGNSYHVLWKTTQRTQTTDDGPTKTATFDPDTSQPAYSTNYPSNTISIFGEWERLPKDQVNLATGSYNCQIVLTEESCHGSGGALAGNWAGTMTASINFQIGPQFPVPEYPLAALMALIASFAGFIVLKKRSTLHL